jgi:hypothetical protein
MQAHQPPDNALLVRVGAQHPALYEVVVSREGICVVSIQLDGLVAITLLTLEGRARLCVGNLLRRLIMRRLL